MKYSVITFSYNVGRKIPASLNIPLLMKYPRPLLSPHFTWACQLCPVFRCTTFLLNERVVHNPLRSSHVNQKERKKKETSREKKQAGSHVAWNLEAGALCYTMCSNYLAHLLTPAYEPFLENNGRFSAFLSGVCCLVLNLSCWESLWTELLFYLLSINHAQL